MAADPNNDLLLITCAGGKQIASLLPLLSGKWKRLRLAVHSEGSAKRLRQQYPDAEVIQPDLGSPAEVRDAMKGVTVVYHVGPTLHPHETEFGYNMIDAAIAESKSGNFKHFVMSSVFPTQLRKLMNHDCKRYIEEYLMESGLNFTILQPSHMFDNTKVATLLDQVHPVHPMAYSPEIKFSFTALRDLSEAASLVLEQREKHYFAVYPIISTMPTPYTAFISAMEKAIGKKIEVKQIPFMEAVEGFTSMIGGGEEVPPGQEDEVMRLLLYYNRRGLLGNPSVTEWLLGRKATSCEQWAETAVADARRK